LNWSKSSWTQLGVVNGDPSSDAHTPSVAVDEFGTVAVSYYDYRFKDVNSDDGLETAHWIRRSSDGGASFRPAEMLGTTFDTRKAPYSSGYFLGDYTAWPRSERRSSPSGSRPRDQPPASRPQSG
jgi:hypothetical protein